MENMNFSVKGCLLPFNIVALGAVVSLELFVSREYVVLAAWQAVEREESQNERGREKRGREKELPARTLMFSCRRPLPRSSRVRSSRASRSLLSSFLPLRTRLMLFLITQIIFTQVRCFLQRRRGLTSRKLHISVEKFLCFFHQFG